LGTVEVLYYTRPSRAVKQQFDKYFMGGMNVSEKPLLAQLSTPNQELLASGTNSGAKSI